MHGSGRMRLWQRLLDQLLHLSVPRVVGRPPPVGDLSPAAVGDGQRGLEDPTVIDLGDVDQRLGRLGGEFFAEALGHVLPDGSLPGGGEFSPFDLAPGVVPEPATMALLAVGGLLLRRKIS